MFDTYLKLLEKLGQVDLSSGLDASRLVNAARELPLPLGVALVVAGLVSCLAGGRRYVFRLVLAPLAIAAGLAFGPKAAPLLHLSPTLSSYLAAGLVGTTALLLPPAILFVAFGALGALLGAELAGENDYWLGFIPGFVVGGALSLALHRILAVMVSSLVGAGMFVLGLLTLISFTPLAPMVFGAPVLSLGLAGCVAVASLAFQFKFSGPTDEERDKARADKRKAKDLKVDAKARDKRFKEYDRRASR
jgi:hypothetical protein